MRPDRPRRGQPLRALAGLGMVVIAVEVIRLPQIAGDYAAGVAAMATAQQSPASPGPAAQAHFPALAAAAVSAAAAQRPVAVPAVFTEATCGHAATPLPRRSPGGPVTEATVAVTASVGAIEPPHAGQVAPQPALAATPPRASGFDLATTGYAALAAGERRAAARAFDAALAAEPAHPRAEAWAMARRALGRRWSGDAWWLLRRGGGSGFAASPVLGGGQAGASLAYALDPLARQPLALVTRVAVAALPARRGIALRGFDGDSAQLALGVRWTLAPGINLTGERLVAAGRGARDDWALRLAAGSSGSRGRTEWSAYGEAGVLGDGASYAAGQAGVTLRLADKGALRVSAGPAVWASIQHDAATASRVDAGPSLALRLPLGRAAIAVAADYRFRIAGNAAPGSGPAVTVSAAF